MIYIVLNSNIFINRNVNILLVGNYQNLHDFLKSDENFIFYSYSFFQLSINSVYY
jgi:hypothetical protein